MGRKRVLAWVGVLAVLGAGLWWRLGARDETESDAATTTEVEPAASPSALRARARIDPATLPVASLAGTVRTRGTDAVIAGARVCVRPDSSELAGEDTRLPLCTTTDEGGRYRFAALVPARYTPVAAAAGHMPGSYEPASDDAPDYIELGAGDDRDGVDVLLDPGGAVVRGVVRDIGGGPIAGALVSARQGRFFSRNAGVAVETDAGGEFELFAAPGDVTVSAFALGYAAGSTQGVAPGQYLEVLLTPEAVLAGVVVEAESGAPVSRARVTASNFEYSIGAQGSAFTDDRGRFRITGLSPGRYKPGAEIAGGYGETRESVRLGFGQTIEDLRIELHKAPIVTGTVLVGDGDDTPCVEGWVSLRRADERRWASIDDRDGRVEFDAVLNGEYDVDVACEGYRSEDEYPAIVVEGDVAEQIWRVREGGAVVGHVRSDAGDPIAGARVMIRGVAGDDPRAQLPRAWQETDRDGRYEARGLPAGTAKLSASTDDHPGLDEPLTIEIPAAGEVEADITLPAGGTIAGRVVDARGEPVAGASVRAVGATRQRFSENTSGQTRDDGSFELDVAPGKHRVYASRGRWGGQALGAPGASDDDEAGKSVSVRAGERSEVELVVEPQDGVISGVVVDASGAPVTDAFVAAEREPDGPAASKGRARYTVRWGWNRKPAMTDTDGKFELTKLSPGRYTVRAHRRGGGEAIAEGVAVGSSATLTIAETGSLAGSVKVEGGTAPDHFRISLVDEETGFRRSESFYRTGGTFSLRELPAGTFEVSVMASGGTATEEVELAAGQDRVGIVLGLAARATITGRVVDLESGEPLAGFRTLAWPLDGAGGSFNEDKERITGADGRFVIDEAPAGRIRVIAIPLERAGDARYNRTAKLAVATAGETTDVGDLTAVVSKLAEGERAGDYGFDLREPPPGKWGEELPLEVASVREGGPAAATELAVGDEIVSVDGHDVRSDRSMFYSLVAGPEGTTITLGLARDVEVEITAGPPRVDVR